LRGSTSSPEKAQAEIRQNTGGSLAIGFDSLHGTMQPCRLGAATMKWGADVVALQSAPPPVVYFDNSPCISHLNSVIGVTLTVSGGLPTESEGVEIVASIATRLKCNISAAIALRSAIDKALLLAQPANKS